MINFIYRWGTGPRKESWSGTPYGIEEALKKQTQVNDLSLQSEGRMGNIVRRIEGKIVYGGDDFNIIPTLRGIREIHAKGLNRGVPNLVFTEFTSDVVGDTYSYQDLTVDFIMRFGTEQPDLARFTPLPGNANARALRQRKELTDTFNRNCRGLFTMSKWLANDLITRTGVPAQKVHWVGGGCNVDPAKIDHSKKTGSRYLFVGKDWQRKNGPLVVKAFEKVKKIHPEAELYIAGPIDCPNEAKNIKGVTFLGQLTYDQLVPYYNCCDCFVMPSQFEAYGIVFAEALIYGLPCIGKNCFAMPEFIRDGENGYLIEKNDADELAGKMVAVLENHEMIQAVMSKTVEYQRQFSWDAVASRIIAVMKEDGYEV